MKIKNKYLLSKLVSMGIFPVEQLSYTKNDIDNDNIVTDVNGQYFQVFTEDISNEEVFVALELEKIKTLHSIKSMIKFFVVLTGIGLLFYFLFIVNEILGV